MNSHDIGFYEEISKIITELSSNILNTHLISSPHNTKIKSYEKRLGLQ